MAAVKNKLFLLFAFLSVMGFCLSGCASNSNNSFDENSANQRWHYCGPANQNIRSRTWDCGDTRPEPIVSLPQQNAEPAFVESRAPQSSSYTPDVQLSSEPEPVKVVSTSKMVSKPELEAHSKEVHSKIINDAPEPEPEPEPKKARQVIKPFEYNNGNWLVQLAAFQQRSKAERFLVNHDQISNLKIEDIFVAGKQWYRVIAYSGASRDEAKAIAQDISLQYPAIKPWIRKAQ